MVSILERLLGRRSCEKLIKYQARTFSFDASISSDIIDLSNITTHVEKIEEAGDVTKAWDDYQYGLCKLYRDVRNSDPDYRIYRRKMESALRVFTRLRLALSIVKRDQRRGFKRLDKAMDAVDKLLDIEDELELQNDYLDDAGIGTRVRKRRVAGGG